MNSMLVYMADEQAGGEDAAIEFLSRHGDLWKSWVPADVATKVEAAM
jgi:glycine betaine/proline transport system substrate-binding protein